MALTPAAIDPNRKKELERINKIAKSANGKELVKNEFNIDLNEKTDIKVKDSEAKKEEAPVEKPKK